MTPARKAILDTMLEGPVEVHEQHKLREWRFIQWRDGKHARKFTLIFYPQDRSFSYGAVRRRSKRTRRTVRVTQAMKDYLRSRLHPLTIAACVVAALSTPKRSDDEIPF